MLRAYGHNGTEFVKAGGVRVVQEGAINSGNVPSAVVLMPSNTSGELLDAFIVHANGNTEIGFSLAHKGSTIGFNGVDPTTKGTITGSRGGNAALASLLTYLALRGDITDSTS